MWERKCKVAALNDWHLKWIIYSLHWHAYTFSHIFDVRVCRKKEHTWKEIVKYVQTHTYTYFEWPVWVWVSVKCRMFIERDWAQQAHLVQCLLHTHTYIYASRPCNDWKWNKKTENSLEITYTDRPLTQSYERAIVADLFFFSPLKCFYYNFKYCNCYTCCCRHQCCCRCQFASRFKYFFKSFFPSLSLSLSSCVWLLWNNISSTCEKKEQEQQPNNRYRAKHNSN